MSNKIKHSLLASSTEATSSSAEIATEKNAEEWESNPTSYLMTRNSSQAWNAQ